MKKPFVFLTIVFCACVLSNWTNAVGQTAPNLETFIAVPQVHLRVLPVSGVGLEFSKASFETDYGRGVSLVSFTVTNTSGKRVTNVHFALYVLDRFNGIARAQLWCAADKLQPGQVRQYSTDVPAAFSSDTNVLLTLRHVTIGGEQFDVPGRLVKRALELKSLDESLSPELSAWTGPADPDYFCDPSFCQTCRLDAQEDCPNGIKSFSCSISKCECVYTCK